MTERLNGYWIGPWFDLPEERPDWTPAQAVLRRVDEPSPDDFLCLSLVRSDALWVPLSEAGASTYAHSIGLALGEAWRFVCFVEGGRLVFAAQLEEPLAPHLIERLYGAEAAAVAHPERYAIQLRLRRRVDP